MSHTSSHYHMLLPKSKYPPSSPMGLSASKRVQKTLTNSPVFNSACVSVYTNCRASAQYVFPGVKPYQLLTAMENLHHTLSISNQPMGVYIIKWVPYPPDRSQVDRALKAVLSRRSGLAPAEDEEIVLDESMFKEFAMEVFVNAAVSRVGNVFVENVQSGALVGAGLAGMAHVLKWPSKGFFPGYGFLSSVIVSSAVFAYLGLGGDV